MGTMAPDDRNAAPATHYTMKTSPRATMSPSAHAHAHAHAQHPHHPQPHARHAQANSQSFRANKSTTPVASPLLPHSVGQQYPPRLSPGAAAVDVRSPSPNYFGLNVDESGDLRESAHVPRENWSPPTSSVKSFGTAMPNQQPLNANPEFEAFRRQADANSDRSSFSLGSSHFPSTPQLPMMQPPPPGALRPKLAQRQPTNHSDAVISLSRPPLGKARDTEGSRMDVDGDSLHDSAYVSSESKRNSEASLNPPTFFDIPKQESPAQTDSPFQPLRRSNLSKVEDAGPRLSLPQNKPERAGPDALKPRSETLPSALEEGPGLIMPSQLSDILSGVDENEFLLLDVRVSSHYFQSRIRGALNLCIPTTLLKRPTFDLSKLQKTLQTEDDQQKFAHWRDVKYLIVYDASSSEKRDALSAMNMFKKFVNEGFTGDLLLLRGGFKAFASSYPDMVDRRSAAERAGKPASSSDPSRPTFAPVIGGVALPPTENSANPFFGNIRQNMDLADGVGQMDVAVPPNLDPSALPQWLRDASTKADHGKSVAEKFLRIERNEQSRMKDAYSSFNNATPTVEAGKVLLSGVEKGGKNRYKDILPFEHARVHLADRSDGACDYINASHIRSVRSNKHYIASQGPLPTTFDDFWSAIWDQDVRVVVMLTAESEGGQLKCHPYWQNREFGPLKLKPLSEKKVSLDIDKRSGSQAPPVPNASNSNNWGRHRANTATMIQSAGPGPAPQLPLPSQSETPYVVIRKFALSHAAHPFAPIREITHLHYPSWPDFGVPAQPSHLLALIELANVMQRAALPVDANAIAASVASENPASMHWYDEPESDSHSRPMLVHCSAGCGRTGTFCTIDTVIDMLKRQRLATLAPRQPTDGEGGDDVDMDTEPPRSFGKGGNARDAPQTETNLDTTWLNDFSMDLVENTVEEFRGQRLSMVQSLRQFVLCYETVLEWVWRMQERGRGVGRARSGSLAFPPGR